MRCELGDIMDKLSHRITGITNLGA